MIDFHVLDTADVDRMERLASALPGAELVASDAAARVLDLRRQPYRTEPRAAADFSISTRSNTGLHLASSALPADFGRIDLDAFEALFTPGPFTEFLGRRYAPSFAIGVPAYDSLFTGVYDAAALRSTLGIPTGRRVALFLVDGPDDPLRGAALALTRDFELLLCGDIDPGQTPGAIPFARERARMAALFAVADVVIGSGSRSTVAEAALIAERATVAVGPVDRHLGAVVARAEPGASVERAVEQALVQHDARADARETLAERWFAHRDGTASQAFADRLGELADSRRRVAAFHGTRAPRKPNVVWICVDGLRPDRLDHAPFTAELFSRGALFTNVYSAAAGTHTAMHSAHTAMYPANHRMLGWTPEALRSVDPQALSLADVLQHDGYRTFRYCDLAGEQVCPKSGFEVWEHGGFPVGHALAQTDRTLDITARKQFFERYTAEAGPKFAYVHLELLHELNCEMGPVWTSGGYDRNVAKMDDGLRAVLDELALEQGDLLVVSTDHGAKLDVAYAAHEREAGPRHEEEAARTFTAFLSPQLEARRIDTLVRSVDVAPTILDLIGASALHAQGRSLLPVLLGAEPQPLWAFREKGAAFDDLPSPNESNTWCVQSGRWKYAVHASRPECEWLIDLESDADFSVNHLGRGLDVEEPLRVALDETLIRSPESADALYVRRGQALRRSDIPPVLSIVVLTEQSDRQLDLCLASLRAQVGPAFEILESDSLQAVVDRVRGEAVALALPDAAYDEECIYALWTTLQSEPTCGAANSGYRDGERIRCAPDPGRARHLGPGLLLRRDVFRSCVASLQPEGGLAELHTLVAQREHIALVPRPLARWSPPATQPLATQPLVTQPLLTQKRVEPEPLLSILVGDARASEVERLAMSLAGQTDSRFELVFAGAGELESVRKARSRGRSEAERLNAAAHCARGDLLCVTTGDVWLAPTFVSSMRAALGEFPHSVAYSSFAVLDATDRIERVHLDPEVLYRKALCRPPELRACVYPREAHEILGAFDTRLGTLTRWDFLVRLLALYDPVHVPEVALFACGQKNASEDAQRIRDLELARRDRTIDLIRLYPALTDSDRARACVDFGRELLASSAPDPALAERFFEAGREIDPEHAPSREVPVQLPPEIRRRFSAVTHTVCTRAL